MFCFGSRWHRTICPKIENPERNSLDFLERIAIRFHLVVGYGSVIRLIVNNEQIDVYTAFGSSREYVVAKNTTHRGKMVDLFHRNKHNGDSFPKSSFCPFFVNGVGALDGIAFTS